MYITFLMLVIVLIGAFDTASTKKLQQSMPTDFLGFTNYNLMVAALSTIYFFMINKFQIHINVPTLLYSVLYAAVVFVTLTMPILTMKHVSIPMMLVVRTAGSVIVPSLVSGIFLQENIDLFAALSICLLLSAVLLLYFKSNSMKQKSNLFLCVLLFLISGLGTIVMKFYAIDTQVYEVESFYILTNVMLTALCMAMLLAQMIRKKDVWQNVRAFVKGRQTPIIISRVVIVNLSSLATAAVLAQMNMSIYTVLTSASSMLTGFLLSLYYFKEKVSKAQVVAAALAVFAVLFSVL